MYVVYINLLYFLSIFLFTYNKNLLSQKKICKSKPISKRHRQINLDLERFLAGKD